MSKTFACFHFAWILGLSIATGCSRDKPTESPPPVTEGPPPSATPVAVVPPGPLPAAAAPAQPTASAVVPKTDAVDAASLKAGLDKMRPRIRAQIDGYTTIAPREDHRFFMHPDEKKNAVLEFDVKGIKSLALAPYIEDFSGNADCMGNPLAGVVQLTWSLDGGEKHAAMIDRTYDGTVKVDVGKAKRLKVEVDKGNDVTFCDWASVGFVNVE
jgi:hypothetical protein